MINYRFESEEKSLIKTKVLDIPVEKWNPLLGCDEQFLGKFKTVNDKGTIVELLIEEYPNPKPRTISVFIQHADHQTATYSYKLADSQPLLELHKAIYEHHDLDGHARIVAEAEAEERRRQEEKDLEYHKARMQKLEELF